MKIDKGEKNRYIILINILFNSGTSNNCCYWTSVTAYTTRYKQHQLTASSTSSSPFCGILNLPVANIIIRHLRGNRETQNHLLQFLQSRFCFKVSLQPVPPPFNAIANKRCSWARSSDNSRQIRLIERCGTENRNWTNPSVIYLERSTSILYQICCALFAQRINQSPLISYDYELQRERKL